MKVLCPACDRLLELSLFRTEAEAVVVTCVKCGVATRVEAHAAVALPSAGRESAKAPSRVTLVSTEASNVVSLRTTANDAVQFAAQSLADPFALPEGVCPKCLAPRGERGTCGQCGLEFTAAPTSFAPSEWLKETWVALLRDWGNESAHSQARAEASRRGELPELGRLYRLRLAWFKDDPVAGAAKDEILRMATASVALSTASGTDEATEPRLKSAVMVLIIIVMVVATAFVMRLLLQGIG